ncbi:UNVERIFIED_CONTAM: hypothetical protein PYX00_001584 [Menopon gallinae]|uniref:Alpha-tubulin N-acetyltransferase n=1 Tax=Menopon gallinae TaxID=328185 RepID=A0AAW2IEP5_9NEOP
MEFNFNINNYFKNEITIVGSSLIPDGFTGDRREIQECISRVSHVLSVLGENSAKAQGLQKVITSGEKLRNTDHVVYILTDPQGGRSNFSTSRGTGSILGMLKMGVKHLYVFDDVGNSHEVSPRCVLDFYIHESKQRMGLGKKLFQYMLKEEKIEPHHLAIDKPSPKFLSFLRKHYGLNTVIPQMNNFVVFTGFFTNRETGGGNTPNLKKVYAAGVSSSSARYQSSRLSGYTTPILAPQPQGSSSAININQSMHFGRQAPHRPVSTVGLILQHKGPSNSTQSFQPGRG